MKVVLVNPPVERIVERRYDTPEFPHLGLGYIAAYLISKGISCEIIDAKFECINLNTLLNRLDVLDPQVVGLTAMTHEIDSIHRVAKSIKQRFPEVKIVLGGIHASVLPTETLKDYSCFDFVIIGEGEETFYEFVKNLEDKDNKFEGIKGLGYRKAGVIKINGLRQRIKDLDRLPFPAWEHLPVAKEYPIMTSRGCPFECIFCANPNGRILRKRSVANVVDEFELVVKRYKPQRIVFWDEALVIDRERANKILDVIIKRGLNKEVKWYAQTHVNSVDYPLFKKMKEAGCISIGLGIESGNERILSQLKKKTTLQRIEVAVKDAKRARLPVEGYFIFGHPYETKETACDTIRFAVRLNPDFPVFGIMVPYPGTEVYRMAKNGEGNYKLLSKDWSVYNKQLGNALELKHLNRQQLELLQLEGYLSVFIFNLRFISLIKFIVKYRREEFTYLKKVLFGRLFYRPKAI